MATKNGTHVAERLEIDMDAMTIGDIELFDNVDKMGPIIDLLDRIVVGGARHRPVSEMRQIMAAVKAYTGEMVDPN